MPDVRMELSDALEFMKTLEAGSVQVCVTDPPYGIGENSNKNNSRGGITKFKGKHNKYCPPKDYGNFDWDSQPATQEQINECQRVSKNQVIFGGNYFNLPPSPCWLVWDKLNGGNDFADCELAWTSYKTAVRKFTYLWNGMIKEHPEKRYHPTQKPLALMLWVIENYTKPGDTILDPFAGSGTTAIACIQLGRNFLGCDSNPAYVEIARRRIAAAMMQEPLF